MKFETIETLVKDGEPLKVHIIDYWDPSYFITGRVTRAYTGKRNKVNLYPYFGLKLTEGHVSKFAAIGDYEIVVYPEFPQGSAGQAGPILMRTAGGPTRMRVTTGSKTHERYASILARKLCVEETEEFKEYTQSVRGFK